MTKASYARKEARRQQRIHEQQAKLKQKQEQELKLQADYHNRQLLKLSAFVAHIEELIDAKLVEYTTEIPTQMVIERVKSARQSLIDLLVKN